MDKLQPPTFYSGLSGLQLNVRKSEFPEPFRDAARLTYYSSLFNSIEINSTFYKIPLPSTITRWASTVGVDFRFTFKIWKEITHRNELRFHEEDVIRFFDSANCISDKKGCLLIQLPNKTGFEYFEQLTSLLSCLTKNNKEGWKLVIEFRNNSWYNESTFGLLKQHDITLVIHDMPGSSTPETGCDNNICYYRFHGPQGNYRGSYPDEFLWNYAARINDSISKGKTVFMYFNNTMGDALGNLRTINDFLIKINCMLLNLNTQLNEI